ncbi:glycoside hydrolase superfamily [Dichotomocladium elegans]|nr:glycoside hydrolase superfamily [Dichotomocladium elegans]
MIMKFASYTIFALAAAALVRAADTFYGLNYGIDEKNCPTVETMKTDFTAAKKYTNRIRTFTLSPCNQAQLALQATQALGMRIYLGMWIDRQDTFDREMAALKRVITSDVSNVDAIIVGSETLYRNETDPVTYQNWIKQVKDVVSGTGIKVTAADVYYKIPPEVVSVVDFVMMNAFPYWEGVAVEQAADILMDHYHYVKSIANGKDVKISETGWPSAGANFESAVPSIENENLYLRNVLCKAKQENVDIIYFSLKDEPYKGTEIERSFGILDANNKLKQGIDPTPSC